MQLIELILFPLGLFLFNSPIDANDSDAAAAVADDTIRNLETITIENHVRVLDESNYETFVQQNRIALVEFYAPWCGHCKSLEPEFAEAARILQDDPNRVTLAKIDATKFSELAQKNEVTGFPTLFIYLNGTKQEYDGPRTAQGIVEHMREIADPNYRPPEEAVITLNEINFQSTIDSEQLILVEFYAPWCGHCKRLKPEYERAAKRLKQIENPIKLAKIDATVEKNLASKFDVKGYPTLIVFRKGKKSLYKGPRDENGIVDYMKRFRQTPSKRIDEKKQLSKEIKEDIPTVVGFFPNDDLLNQSNLFDLFIDAAYDQFDENNHFVHIIDAKLVEELKQKPNSLVVFNPILFRSKYENNSHSMILNDATSLNEVIHFIANHSVPLVGFRNSRTYNLYANRYPIVVVYYDVDFSFDHRKQTQMIREEILKAAAEIRQTENITFVIAHEMDNALEMKELKLDESGEDVNVGYYQSPRKRYAMEPNEDFNHQLLIDFIRSVLDEKIKPVIRSQIEPAINPIDNIWTIVGETFDRLVNRSEQNLLIEFYAPWCRHCQEFEPIYRKLAETFSNETDRLRLMKIDATANDFPESFVVNGFPTIYYVGSNKDDRRPLLYTGQRDLADLTKFIRNQIDSAFPTDKEEL
ncbi:Protein disulfide-isomerase A4 [Sarcoptes scabiei]|nr:Protein disulfide-isomerase A4 [Sarcoptes scabiei]